MEGKEKKSVEGEGRKPKRDREGKKERRKKGLFENFLLSRTFRPIFYFWLAGSLSLSLSLILRTHTHLIHLSRNRVSDRGWG